MSRKQFREQVVSKSVYELFERFVASQSVKGISDKTIQTYHSHLRCLARHMDFSVPLADIQTRNLEDMILSI